MVMVTLIQKLITLISVSTFTNTVLNSQVYLLTSGDQINPKVGKTITRNQKIMLNNKYNDYL